MSENTPPKPSLERSDEELVAEAQVAAGAVAGPGDSSALGELVKRHRHRVAAIVRRYVESDAAAEDIAQLVFVRAHERLDSFRGESLYRTWLYRIAVNLALNHRRDNARLRPIEEAPDATTSPFATARVVAREARSKLAAAIETLPPKQRLIVELRLLDELPFSEVAVIAECTEDSAKSNFHHALKKLRELLGG